jgi:DNA-binding XRE family transcriptional regulator
MVSKQETLAQRTGISRSTISALENNKLFLSAPYALLIAETLGCALGDLYEEVSSGAEERRCR